jgi:radical SAM superfamily enzyme with C-terminal helix-hairpin-helix motif
MFCLPLLSRVCDSQVRSQRDDAERRLMQQDLAKQMKRAAVFVRPEMGWDEARSALLANGFAVVSKLAPADAEQVRSRPSGPRGALARVTTVSSTTRWSSGRPCCFCQRPALQCKTAGCCLASARLLLDAGLRAE